MRVEPQQLKMFLLDSGLVTSKELAEAEEKAKKGKKISATLSLPKER